MHFNVYLTHIKPKNENLCQARKGDIDQAEWTNNRTEGI